MERPFEGPDPYQHYLDSHTAGRWLGAGNAISAEMFDALMAEHLPTVQPIRLHSRLKVWVWEDIAVLAYVLRRGSSGASEKPGK